jgi:hypothetical protein
MNNRIKKQLYGDFQSSLYKQFKHHVELAMAHAFLFMDGRPDRIMHILNMVLVEILFQKLCAEVIAVPESLLLLIYFQMYQSLFNT